MDEVQKLPKKDFIIFVGLAEAPKLHVFLFVIFNLFDHIGWETWSLVLILLDFQLHIPMYIFLSKLSSVNGVSASAVTPKVIEGFHKGDKFRH